VPLLHVEVFGLYYRLAAEMLGCIASRKLVRLGERRGLGVIEITRVRRAAMCGSEDVKSLGSFGDPCKDNYETKDVHKYRRCSGGCSPGVARSSLAPGVVIVMDLDNLKLPDDLPLDG